MKKLILATSLSCSALFLTACSTMPSSEHKNITTNIHLVDTTGIGKNIGTVRFFDSSEGLVIQTNLKELPAGPHGFHIHENPSCDADTNPQGILTPALKAGGHFDPNKTGAHGSPTGNGHLGDLPTLVVSENQTSQQKLIAPRLNTDLIKGRSIMVHAGADNYSDHPQPLGGGGARIACGVIVK